MPDYSKGKIYKIVCNTTGLVYIGSTCEPTLVRRLAGHRAKYIAYLNGKANKYSSFDVLKNSYYSIVLIENVTCLSKDELHARERHFIESMECVNKVIPIRSLKEFGDYHSQYRTDNQKKNQEYRTNHKAEIKEYYISNKDEISDQKKLYYENNKDKISDQHKHYYAENIEKIKEMMDYNNRDERERKQMHHSSGPVCIYRAGLNEIE
jgi:hypothetical protein